MSRGVAVTCAALLALGAIAADAQETLTRGKNIAVDVSDDGRLAVALAGDIWTLPLAGGEAQPVTAGWHSARRPRWSPDGSQIAYQASPDGRQQIWIYDLAADAAREVSDPDALDIQADWHPDGKRLVFASDRDGTGFDLWEMDLPTGLRWRLSNQAGDETDPAWSADGRHLVYVHHVGEQWSLVLRRHGEPEEVLVTADEKLAAPSWRPDGSLIMFWQQSGTATQLRMVILSQPRLVRDYANGEDYVLAPVSWLDRHRLFYTAGGAIRQRLFNSWTSRTVPFRATLAPAPAVVTERVRRTLPRIDEPATRPLVIRAARLFDGVVGEYQYDRDIVIEGGYIRSVETRGEHPDATVIDMGDLTVLPGFIDVAATLPAGADAQLGPLLLATGVTTIITGQQDASILNETWSGKTMPGPRILDAATWQVGDRAGIADATTPGLGQLLESRQARLLGFDGQVPRRFTETPSIDSGVTDVVLASQQNGLPAGLGLHAELRALVAAGLQPVQVLRAAGVNAAAIMGVDPALGRIATGAVADLVLVDGDPLTNVNTALNVVAIVRNGRFFSVAGLIDKARTAKSVE